MDRDDYGELVGHCGVDSGQIMVVDPCYVKSWKDGDAFPGLDPDAGAFDDALNARVEAYIKGEYEPQNDYESACLATMSKKRAGMCFGNEYRRGLAVATSTGFGDGEYPVYVQYSDEGAWGRRVASLTIVFIPEQVRCPECGYHDCEGCEPCHMCGDTYCDGSCEDEDEPFDDIEE